MSLSFNWSSAANRTNGSDAACRPVDTSAHLFFTPVYGLVFLVGLLLNAVTLKVYFCRAAPQQPSSSVTVYLKNLAAADLLISLCLPVRIANYAGGSAAVRRLYCTFGASAFYLNTYASILFMGYIAANRYLKIVHPMGTHILQTVRAARVVSTVTWAFLLATTAAYVGLSLLAQEASPPPPAAAPGCDALHGRLLRLLYRIIHACSATAFLFVLAALVFFYHGTARRLALAQQRQPASSGSRKLAKSRRNMSVLVGVFCVCFVPYHLVRLPYVFLGGRCSLRQVFFYLKELTVMMSVLNVCLDPLIYFLFCQAFRAQLGLRRSSGAGATAERRSSNGATSRTKHSGVV